MVMKPSKVLRTYLFISCASGLLLALAAAFFLRKGDLELPAALILPLFWNVLLMLILPLVLDWSERKYFKARFICLEELAKTNPELKSYLETQCEKHAVSELRLALLDSSTVEPCSYGLWRYNPRLIVSQSILLPEQAAKIMPGIEMELNKFARQEISFLFVVFTVIQIVIQQCIVRLI